ncbi:MAG: hypothetical protein ACRCYV_11450 [Aeromonas sp.]
MRAWLGLKCFLCVVFGVSYSQRVYALNAPVLAHPEPSLSQRLLTPKQQEKQQRPVWQSDLNSAELLNTPQPLSFGIEVSVDNFGKQTLRSYHQLNLKPQKGVSLSFEEHKPKIKFKAGGMDTAIKLRSDGVKLQLRPIDKSVPLKVELKITDDESSLQMDYRF